MSPSPDARRRRAALLAPALATTLAIAAVSAGAAPSASVVGMRVHDVTLDTVRSAGTVARTAATWCGEPATEDRTPNVVAGYPVKWIYAVPADGADQLSTFASVMQTDAEAIDAWWRREDPVRTPRNDLAQFACGVQLDVSAVRLPQPGAELAGPSGRFNAVVEGLLANGFRSERTKYVVYLDAPVGNSRICGQGGSDRSGFGVAVVYVQACSGVSTATVAVHELVHTLGGVPVGAPNACPEDRAHTCDDPRDLMHPFIGLEPLEAKLLDPGRDDYYGHSGTWLDAQDSPWLVQLDRQVPLALSVAGAGRVAADAPGLDCDRSCTTTWNDQTRLALTASPAPGAKLVRWGGACSGSAACTVTVAQGGAVSALFAPASFRVGVSIAGRGTIRSARPGITCRPRCAAAFPSHVPLRLTARPAAGWRLRSWAGACRGSRPVCTVPMTRAASARAIFVRA